MWIMLFTILMGCQQDIPVPVSPPKKDPTKEWTSLLLQISTEDGLDFEMLQKNEDILNRYVAWTGTLGPQSNLHSKDDVWPKNGQQSYRLVHFINAYNAWLLRAYLNADQPQNIDQTDFFGGFFWGQRVWVDGEWMSFTHLSEERLLATFQEPKIHIMLHQLGADSPDLQFWHPNTWKSASDMAFQRFLNSSKGSRKMDDGQWEFNQLFQDWQKDFIDWSNEDNLCSYLGQYAEEDLQQWLKHQSTEGCPLNFFETNWTVPKNK